jgi:hypothetical protein
MTQENQTYDDTLSPELGSLFAKYYLFVKKQKRDIEYFKEFDLEELHDLQYTLLLFLNHIGTDLEQNPLDENNIKENIDGIINHCNSKVVECNEEDDVDPLDE